MDLISTSSPQRLQPTLVLATLSAGFGSAFQYGYNIAVVNTPHKVLKSFYNDTYYARHGTSMDEKHMLLLWSCTVSMFPLGGLLGSLMVGGLVDKCGRKGTLLINNIFAIVPAILMGVSKAAKAFELIILSRVLLGVCAGISYSALPMYLGELAPKNLRGTLGTMTEVFVIVGVFLAQIFSLQAVLGNPAGWPVLLALTGVPALLQLLSLPFFPESPRYTLIQRGDEDTARQALRKLRGWADVEDEIEEMRVEDQAERAEGRLSVLNLFTFRPLRWQLISIIVLMAGQQLSGVNAINYYADMIYTSAGISAAHSQYVTVSAGVVNIVMTGVSAGTVEWLGRRLLLLVGYGICGSACLVLTLALLFQSAVHGLSYLGVICVFSYIAGHSIGPKFQNGTNTGESGLGVTSRAPREVVPPPHATAALVRPEEPAGKEAGRWLEMPAPPWPSRTQEAWGLQFHRVCLIGGAGAGRGPPRARCAPLALCSLPSRSRPLCGED
ncbi:Solute carrier family 2, facilitated glucose transporter member 7 [Myotis brandtii]|uniref:Solute carrier family 2, facilitated glucose transporter member 5 n=1 Tax=Myotis brandtii TaxID=109478 RepID=S7N528_MYOBR|nr:Solute carrier family 2, facilitated glucose transporter member 7 [Myotis brandtii]